MITPGPRIRLSAGPSEATECGSFRIAFQPASKRKLCQIRVDRELGEIRPDPVEDL